MRITDFTKGDQARLLSYGATSNKYKRRLLSLGLTCGSEIKVIRFAPFGCPVEFEIRGANITLRKEEAMDLLWERI